MSVAAVIESFLVSQNIDFEKNGKAFLVTLPGEKKLQTHCAVIVGDHSLSINAFVIRKPDENEAAAKLKSIGLSPAQMYDYSLISPTSAETLAKVKKNRRGEIVKPATIGEKQWAELCDLVRQSDPKATIADLDAVVGGVRAEVLQRCAL